ncbi:MAG TPA: hypothetical protein VH684_22215 [Xanthobacteraceae bacterium]|jgi:hypothetical protein
MFGRRSHAGILLVLIFAEIMPAMSALAAEAKYPNWEGEWDYINPRFGGQGVKYDPTKAFGPAQQAPLTPEYQKVHKESMADQAQGGQGNFIDHARCIPGGMPEMMSPARMEVIVTPHTTYLSTGTDLRRIFTDGRPWPTGDVLPTYQGYAIGRWIDEDNDGIYDVLEAETRGPFKGPRAYDATGLPLHFDNQSIFKERFHLDKNNSRILHDEITTIDHALTRPWSVDKTFRLNPNPYPAWSRIVCTETTQQIVIGKQPYMLSAEGLLMPVKKDQAPPDLRYFKQGGP